MTPMTVVGVEQWTDGMPVPEATLVAARLRRRLSPLTRACVGVVGRLAERTGLDPSRVAVIHGSALGEIAVTVDLLRALVEDEGALSPTRFHNSVHNTPAAYLSIATGNRGFSTSLAAGRETAAMALLEAATLLAIGTPEALVLLAEEPVPPELGDAPPYAGLVVALHLRAGEGSVTLHGPFPGEPPSPPAPEITEALAADPCAPAWVLAESLALERSGPVALGSPSAPWWARIEVRS